MRNFTFKTLYLLLSSPEIKALPPAAVWTVEKLASCGSRSFPQQLLAQCLMHKSKIVLN